MITTNDVCAVTGIAPSTLTDWVAAGVVVPVVAGGPGRGKSRRFAPLKVVGIAVGALMYASDRGCLPEYVGAVAEAFAAVTDEWLRAEFAAGRTHFVALIHGRPILREPQPYDLPDVKAAYDRVMAYVK